MDIEKDIDNPRSLMTLLAEHTGMRIGELTALHKSDVDFKKGYIHVHRQQHKYHNSEGHLEYEEVPYTKDEKKHPHGGRRVPLFPESRRAIELALALYLYKNLSLFYLCRCSKHQSWQAMHRWTTASKIDLALLDARSSSLLAGKHPWPL